MSAFSRCSGGRHDHRPKWRPRFDECEEERRRHHHKKHKHHRHCD